MRFATFVIEGPFSQVRILRDGSGRYVDGMASNREDSAARGNGFLAAAG